MFPPKKKKPGLDIAIAVGKPKSDLGEPGPLDEEEKPSAEHEADETPDEEESEEYGANLLSDMVSPLVELGLPEEHAKETLAKIFTAAAKCLGGKTMGEQYAEEGSQQFGVEE